MMMSLCIMTNKAMSQEFKKKENDACRKIASCDAKKAQIIVKNFYQKQICNIFVKEF